MMNLFLLARLHLRMNFFLFSMNQIRGDLGQIKSIKNLQ